MLTDSLTVDLLAEHVRGEGAPDRPTPTEWDFLTEPRMGYRFVP